MRIRVQVEGSLGPDQKALLAGRFKAAAEGVLKMPCSLELEEVPERFELGHLTLEGSNTWWKDTPINLTPPQQRVVSYLAQHARIGWSSGKLYAVAQETDSASEDRSTREAMRSMMARIRRKFENADGSFDRIEAIPRFGYQWM